MAEKQEEKNPWWSVLDEIIKAIESWWEPAHSIVSRLWRAADGYVRFAIRLIIWSSLIIIGGMVYGDRFISSLIASLPIIGIILLLARKPIVVGLIAGADEKLIKGACRRALMTIIGVELMVGIYASIFRAANDRKLIPLFLVVIFTLIVLAFAKKISFFSYAKVALWIILFAITVIWVAGGREEIKKMADKKPPEEQKKIGYIQDGYYVTQSTVIRPYAKKPNKVEVDADGGNKFTAIVNCDKKIFIADIGSSESVRIHHKYYGEMQTYNRCSFNPSGDSFPIYGCVEGQENLPRYKNDLPFQQFCAHAVVFYLVNSRGKIITADYIRHEGGVLNFTNYSGEKAQLYLVYNFSQTIMASEMAEQIGWDGSTASFEAVKY